MSLFAVCFFLTFDALGWRKTQADRLERRAKTRRARRTTRWKSNLFWWSARAVATVVVVVAASEAAWAPKCCCRVDVNVNWKAQTCGR